MKTPFKHRVQSIWRLTWLSLFALLTWPTVAQDAEPTGPVTTHTIAEAIVDGDLDFVPDFLDQRVTLKGVLTSDPLTVNRTMALANMQDDTAGILVFSRRDERLVGQFQSGDEVLVTGKIGQYQGADQILVEEIEFLRETEIPEPIQITAEEFNSERYAGQLVMIRGEIEVIDRVEDQSVPAVLKDASGQVNVYIPSRFYGEPGFVRELLGIPEVEIVGIASQADAKPPFDSGYRLVPRTTADLTFYPEPPYRAMLITISVSLLLIASIMLWTSRRTAEKSAHEMRQLTKELQQSESKLRENQGRLRLLTEQVPAIVWSVDKSMRFISSTGAGLKALNLKQDEVVGMSLFEYFRTDNVKTPSIAAHRRAFNGKPTTFQAEWTGRVYECHLEPMRDDKGAIVGAIGLALDITARHQAEQELKDQSDALRHSQKMEAIGRLAGGVAHDFNNLVTVIRGYCDLISLKLGPDHDLQDWFHEIKDSANRASSLTSQLLAFSRKQVLEPRVIDLNEIIVDMNKLLTRIIGEHIELVSDLSPNLGAVKVDKGQIEQVIMNLAVNAYDAMPKGGKLTLKTVDYTVTKSESGATSQMPAGRYSMMSFEDTGEGMTEEVQSRIFEPFFTTKDVGKGTGLGLATVYGIITQSGGFVEVSSAVGQGTSFRIFFPVAKEGQTEQFRQQEPARSSRGSETILVAEDETAVRSLIKRALEDKGYRVIEAENGLDALQLSDELPDTIDCLVTDVVMPKMSGFKLADEIIKHRPKIKVLYVSGYAYTGRHENKRISPDTFLAKPFSPEMLTMRVRRLLNAPATVPTQS